VRRSAPRGVRYRSGALAAGFLCTVALCGCGGTSTAPSVSTSSGQRAALTSYLRQVEPLRLAVNRLLEGADPILSAYHSGSLTPARASQRMGALERSFADYSVEIAAIQAATPQLRSLHAIYAHTYVFEDSYLSALTTGLAESDLDELPDTQSEQRAAIIQWRIGLEVLARRAHLALPTNLQAAGRGEIRPSPDGS
jgi:hypothetical protein